MIFYFNAVGISVGSIPERIFQGSNRAGKILFACPTAKANVVDVAFTLPDGKGTPCFLMESVQSVGGVFDRDGEEFNFWEFSLPSAITYIPGPVKAQFFVTNSEGERLSTAVTTFMVEKGVSAIEPEKTDSWQGVVTKLAILDEVTDIIAKKDRLEEIDANFTLIENAFPRVLALAEGANKAVAFENFESCYNSLLNASETEYKVGQSVYIKALNVPDLWVYSINEQKVETQYAFDQEVLARLDTIGYVDFGFYRLSKLETVKVDLSSYASKTDIDVTDNGDGTATLVLNVGA